VTIQAQVLSLMHELQSEFGMAIVFITHDLDEATFAQSLKAFNEDSTAPLP